MHKSNSINTLIVLILLFRILFIALQSDCWSISTSVSLTSEMFTNILSYFNLFKLSQKRMKYKIVLKYRQYYFVKKINKYNLFQSEIKLQKSFSKNFTDICRFFNKTIKQ